MVPLCSCFRRLPQSSLHTFVLSLLQNSHLAVIDALMTVAAMETVAVARTGTSADLLGGGCSWEDALLHWVDVVRKSHRACLNIVSVFSDHCFYCSHVESVYRQTTTFDCSHYFCFFGPQLNQKLRESHKEAQIDMAQANTEPESVQPTVSTVLHHHCISVIFYHHIKSHRYCLLRL